MNDDVKIKFEEENNVYKKFYKNNHDYIAFSQFNNSS